MVKDGAIHGTIIVAIIATMTILSTHLFHLEAEAEELLVYVTFVLSILALGYRWKTQNGTTISLVDPEVTKRIVRYAFGAAIPIASVAIIGNIEAVTDLEHHQAAYFLLIVGIALWSITCSFVTLLVIGGWFKKNNN